MCCNNKLLSAGKHRETKEPLVWCYVEDIEYSNEKLENTLKRHQEHHALVRDSHLKKVKCINTGMVFESISLAMDWCNGNVGNFSRASKEGLVKNGEDANSFYYKKHPITNEKLKWIYM